MSFGLNILLTFVLLAIGSVFSGTGLALVSLRGSQIEQTEQEDARGAKVAKIVRDPNTFLSTVQIGAALCDFLSASSGASSISPHLILVVEGWGVSTGIVGGLVNIVLTLITSYCPIVISEVVPKRIAMQCIERITRAVVPAIDVFATTCHPIIWLIGKNTNGIMHVLGLNPQQTKSEVSDDELCVLVSSNTNLPKDERTTLDDMSDASETIAAEMMCPRADVVFIEADQPLAEAAAFVRDQPYSRYPVTGKDFDDAIGSVYVRDLLDVRDPKAETVCDVVREDISLPGTSKLLPSLELPCKCGIHLAAVIDEYDGTGGIVTPEDMAEEPVGDIHDEYNLPSERGGERTTRTAFVNGMATIEASMTIKDLADLTGVELEDGLYKTTVGYPLSKTGKMGAVGDVPHSNDGYSMVITKVDGRRIKAVEVRKAGAPDHASLPAGPQGGDTNQPRDIHHLFVWPGA